MARMDRSRRGGMDGMDEKHGRSHAVPKSLTSSHRILDRKLKILIGIPLTPIS